MPFTVPGRRLLPRAALTTLVSFFFIAVAALAGASNAPPIPSDDTTLHDAPLRADEVRAQLRRLVTGALASLPDAPVDELQQQQQEQPELLYPPSTTSEYPPAASPAAAAAVETLGKLEPLLAYLAPRLASAATPNTAATVDRQDRHAPRGSDDDDGDDGDDSPALPGPSAALLSPLLSTLWTSARALAGDTVAGAAAALLHHHGSHAHAHAYSHSHGHPHGPSGAPGGRAKQRSPLAASAAAVKAAETRLRAWLAGDQARGEQTKGEAGSKGEAGALADLVTILSSSSFAAETRTLAVPAAAAPAAAAPAAAAPVPPARVHVPEWARRSLTPRTDLGKLRADAKLAARAAAAAAAAAATAAAAEEHFSPASVESPSSAHALTRTRAGAGAVIAGVGAGAGAGADEWVAGVDPHERAAHRRLKPRALALLPAAAAAAAAARAAAITDDLTAAHPHAPATATPTTAAAAAAARAFATLSAASDGAGAAVEGIEDEDKDENEFDYVEFPPQVVVAQLAGVESLTADVNCGPGRLTKATRAEWTIDGASAKESAAKAILAVPARIPAYLANETTSEGDLVPACTQVSFFANETWLHEPYLPTVLTPEQIAELDGASRDAVMAAVCKVIDDRGGRNTTVTPTNRAEGLGVSDRRMCARWRSCAAHKKVGLTLSQVQVCLCPYDVYGFFCERPVSATCSVTLLSPSPEAVACSSDDDTPAVAPSAQWPSSFGNTFNPALFGIKPCLPFTPEGTPTVPQAPGVDAASVLTVTVAPECSLRPEAHPDLGGTLRQGLARFVVNFFGIHDYTWPTDYGFTYHAYRPADDSPEASEAQRDVPGAPAPRFALSAARDPATGAPVPDKARAPISLALRPVDMNRITSNAMTSAQELPAAVLSALTPVPAPPVALDLRAVHARGGGFTAGGRVYVSVGVASKAVGSLRSRSVPLIFEDMSYHPGGSREPPVANATWIIVGCLVGAAIVAIVLIRYCLRKREDAFFAESRARAAAEEARKLAALDAAAVAEAAEVARAQETGEGDSADFVGAGLGSAPLDRVVSGTTGVIKPEPLQKSASSGRAFPAQGQQGQQGRRQAAAPSATSSTGAGADASLSTLGKQ